jgi:hypothetical protein
MLKHLKTKANQNLEKYKVTYQHEYDFEIHCASVTLKNTKIISQTKTSRRSFKKKGKQEDCFTPEPVSE